MNRNAYLITQRLHCDLTAFTQGWPHEFLPIQYSVPVCGSTPQPTTEIMWLICQHKAQCQPYGTVCINSLILQTDQE